MIGCRDFYVKLRKDIDPEAEMKRQIREKGIVHFSGGAFSRKKAYPVLAVDVETTPIDNPAGSSSTGRQAMLLLPNDHGFVVWVDSHFFHFAGLKDKKV